MVCGQCQQCEAKMIVPLAIQRGILLMRLDVEELNLFFFNAFLHAKFFFWKK